MAQRLSSNASAGSSSNNAGRSNITPSAASSTAGQQLQSRVDSAAASSKLGYVASKKAALADVPTLPKLLGFAGEYIAVFTCHTYRPMPVCHENLCVHAMHTLPELLGFSREYTAMSMCRVAKNHTCTPYNP